MALVLFVGFAAVIAVVALVARGKRKSALQQIGAMLGGGDDGSSSAWGSALGASLTLHFDRRGSGSNATNWTEIDVELPARYPLALNVRRHGWFDKGKIERGTMVDVQVGDAAFDETFLVEAAPADVVRSLLTPSVRGALMACSQAELFTDPARPGTARLAVRGWLEDLSELRPVLEAAVEVATGVRRAYQQVTEAEQPVPSKEGSPYRPMLDDAPAQQAAAAREAEVHRVEALRGQRTQLSKGVVAVVFVGIIGYVLWAVANF